MRKWIFASLIFFCAQVEAYSLHCKQVETEARPSQALQDFNMYDIESPERTSTVAGWVGLDHWQWGDNLIQWNYEDIHQNVVTVQFARTPFEELIQHPTDLLVGDIFNRAISPHGVPIRCSLLH